MLFQLLNDEHRLAGIFSSEAVNEVTAAQHIGSMSTHPLQNYYIMAWYQTIWTLARNSTMTALHYKYKLLNYLVVVSSERADNRMVRKTKYHTSTHSLL